MKRALLFACAVSCVAATTQTWEMSGYQDFSRGRMAGLSLTRDGKLTPGPAVNTIFDSAQADIWSVAQAPDGSFYVGTGNRGRVFHVKQSGESEVVWTAEQPEIFTLIVDPKGIIYAASSPDGKVVRIENGKVSDFFSPGARYIWALALAPDGALMVATGDEGKIFRVTPSGQGSVYYETGQSHVTSLAFDAQGRLLAGSEPNGILYRITAPGKAFVLYNAKFPEIRSILTAPDGSVYAAALGGGVAKKVSAASAAAVSSGSNLPVISTTVTVTADQQSGVTPAPKPEAPKLAAPAAQTTVVSPASTVDTSGSDRSSLFKIWPDNTVETLWTSKEENVYDLALDGSSVVFLTDAQGRIYRLEPNGKTTLMAQAGEGDATRLLASPRGLVAATGNLGKLLRLDAATNSAGWFESPVHDAGTVARWGRLSWRGDARGVVLRTRSGNSARPDTTWSDWSAPLTATGAAVTSPNARFIQWRAEFTGASGGIDDVTVPFLPQNTPPAIRSISVIGAQAPASSARPAQAANTTTSYSVTVTDTADSSGTTSQTISRGPGQQLQVAWVGEDPDGDRLIYNLYFRGEEETEWKLLHGNTTDNYYALESDVVADGRYYFRVTASDRLSNPAELAREAEIVSAPVIVDNTPPVVTAGAPRRMGTRVDIAVDAVDRGSLLRRCEYSVDAGPWFPVESSDGVTDSAQEQFPIRIENVSPGEHLISIRVYDGAGNAGLAKAVVR